MESYQVNLELATNKINKQIDRLDRKIRKLEEDSRIDLKLNTRSSKENAKQLSSLESKFNKTANSADRLTRSTQKTSKAGKEFSGVLDEWWKRFGAVSIGFTVVYRAMNALEQGIGRLVDTY